MRENPSGKFKTFVKTRKLKNALQSKESILMDTAELNSNFKYNFSLSFELSLALPSNFPTTHPTTR